MSWKELHFKDFVTLQRGFDLPKSRMTDGIIPVFGSNCVIGFHDEAKVEAPGVVTGRSGTLGLVQYSEQPFWPHNTTLWVKDFKGNSPRFVYYKLQTLHLERFNGGASVPTLNRNVLDPLTVKIPERTAQDRIASTLSAYDDLIENNRRRIHLLERAARLIYKEWFVHLRFPRYERAKIIDGVPEGWERKTLGDVLTDLESGGRPKGGSREEGIPSIGAENVTGIGQYDYSKDRYVPEEYFKAMRKGIVRSRDVLVYKDGVNIGRSSYFGDGFPHEQCAVNEHVFILRTVPDVGQNLLYFWISQDQIRRRIANLNANTAQPGISRSKLKNLSFVQPQQAITRLFNETVEPVVGQIFHLAKEIQYLTQARELLLPRLMNGEVAV